MTMFYGKSIISISYPLQGSKDKEFAIGLEMQFTIKQLTIKSTL
jgi:hypothetical protein